MLVLVNAMLFHLGRVSTAGLSPDMETAFNQADNTRRIAVAILSVFFLVGFALLRMLETHKVAGAAYNLCRRLSNIEAGDFTTRVTLRRTDDLQDVAGAVNSMAASLRDHACSNIRTLENLAASAESLGPGARDLVAGIQALLADERRRVG
jgi:methyl-accepting chemotaxis protein